MSLWPLVFRVTDLRPPRMSFDIVLTQRWGPWRAKVPAPCGIGAAWGPLALALDRLLMVTAARAAVVSPQPLWSKQNHAQASLRRSRRPDGRGRRFPDFARADRFAGPGRRCAGKRQGR